MQSCHHLPIPPYTPLSDPPDSTFLHPAPPQCLIADVGLYTFQEAFDKTGRIINITVAPNNNYDPPRLLNYLTAPHVCVWSAAAASCALPGNREHLSTSWAAVLPCIGLSALFSNLSFQHAPSVRFPSYHYYVLNTDVYSTL